MYEPAYPASGTHLPRGDPASGTVLRSGKVVPSLQAPSSEGSAHGRELSTNTPPNAPTTADLLHAVVELTRRFADFTASVFASFLSWAATSSLDAAVVEFHGFRDDAVSWLQKIAAVAVLRAWPENVKRSFAEAHLRDAARAWNLYDGHSYSTWVSWSEALMATFGDLPGAHDDRLMQMRARCQGPDEDVATYICDKLRLLTAFHLTWESPAARQYVLDGLPDLSMLPF